MPSEQAFPPTIVVNVPRYFFHLFNDVDTPDEEGRELPDAESARIAAQADARTMAAESVRDGHLDLAHFVEVTDEGGQRLFTVTFGEVVDIRGELEPTAE